MASPPQAVPPKFKVFNLFSWKLEVFEESRYKKNLKFDQSLGYQNVGFPPKRNGQNSNFLTTDARHMEFSA